MTKSNESEPKTADGRRAFVIQLWRILGTLGPMVALSATVASLSEFLSVTRAVDQWATVSDFLTRSGPFLAGVIATVVGVSVGVALAQSKGRRGSQAILLEREVKRLFDEALVSSLGRS